MGPMWQSGLLGIEMIGEVTLSWNPPFIIFLEKSVMVHNQTEMLALMP